MQPCTLMQAVNTSPPPSLGYGTMSQKRNTLFTSLYTLTTAILFCHVAPSNDLKGNLTFFNCLSENSKGWWVKIQWVLCFCSVANVCWCGILAQNNSREVPDMPILA